MKHAGWIVAAIDRDGFTVRTVMVTTSRERAEIWSQVLNGSVPVSARADGESHYAPRLVP